MGLFPFGITLFLENLDFRSSVENLVAFVFHVLYYKQLFVFVCMCSCFCVCGCRCWGVWRPVLGVFALWLPTLF